MEIHRTNGLQISLHRGQLYLGLGGEIAWFHLAIGRFSVMFERKVS